MLHAQTVLLEDDFESGASGWETTGDWDVTDEAAFSGSWSLTDSPDDDTYEPTYETSATMAAGVDFSIALDADVRFMAMVDLEEGFDFIYLDVSVDAGDTWVTVETFNGEDMFEWNEYIVPLGGFVGNADVRLRFRFDPDDYVEYDGMYIDNFVITSYHADYSPPLILHTPSALYEGPIEENNITAEVIDISGLTENTLYYSVDGGAYTGIDGLSTFEDFYLYTIPAQEAGAIVKYYITATDGYLSPNTSTTDTFTYVSGNYITYEEGVVDYVYSIGELGFAEQCAVKFTFDGTTNLTTAIIRDYIDPDRLNDSIEIHVWADDGGEPGDDLIAPFKVWPLSTFEEPYIGTYVDLRPYADVLSGISGDVYIGFTSDSLAYITYTNTGLTNRTYYRVGSFWYEFFGDFHIRAVTSEITGAPLALFTYDASAEPVIGFSDASTSSPDTWFWDFGDGTTSTAVNPVHEYLMNGSYNVCLTVENEIGYDTYCELIYIDSYLAPVAEFGFYGDPVVTFTDLSTNEPTAWEWIFDDGSTSTLQNPVHTFAENGAYEVCLTASNTAGASSQCYIVDINTYVVTPVADFTFTISDLFVSFSDISANSPTAWDWDYGDGIHSNVQSPSHLYDIAGTYEVCLTASNTAGSNTTCKTLQVVTAIENLSVLGISISPNPADAYFSLHFPDAVEQKTIIMTDAAGRELLSLNTFDASLQIPTVDLPGGVYFVKIQTAGRTGISPVFVAH
jgi:PKD repeat protein